MPSCAVCTHDQRKAIEAELLSGASERAIAGQFGVARSNVQRHKANHLRAKVRKALAKHEVSVEQDAMALRTKALNLLAKCEDAIEALPDECSKLDVAVALERLRQVPALIGQARGCVHLLGVISGEVPTGSQVTVNFFQKLGVRDESEALGLICQARLLRDANADGDEDSALEVLEGVLRDDPARREPLQRKMLRMIGDVARVDSQPASLGSSPPLRRPRPAPLNGGSNGLPA